jgi:hypothetical protein
MDKSKIKSTDIEIPWMVDIWRKEDVSIDDLYLLLFLNCKYFSFLPGNR